MGESLERIRIKGKGLSFLFRVLFEVGFFSFILRRGDFSIDIKRGCGVRAGVVKLGV